MWKTALCFMTYEKSKLAGILLGIVISMFLVGVQLSLVDLFLEKSTSILRGNHEYIYVVDQKSTSSTTLSHVDNRVGYQLRSISGVDKVFPIIVSSGTCKFQSGGTANVSIIGVQYPEMAGGPKQYTSDTNLSTLRNEGAILIDESDLPKVEKLQTGDYFYLNNHRVLISGMTKKNDAMGTPNVVTTIERARLLTGFNPNHVSAFLLKSSAEDPLAQSKIVAQINKTIPNVKAYTGDDFAKLTKQHNKKTNNLLGFFYMMITFALITGGIIVGLTMFSSVNDRIRDYGTVKAIGGSNCLILKLILQQGILYTLIGFMLTVTLLFAIKFPLGISLSASLLLIVFLMTLVLSLAGSLFCVRKIFKLEPVQIFRM